MTGTLLLAASLSIGAVAQPPPAPLALLDVPYLSQSEALCGGAAAAMVLRYWGEPQVSAEEFAPLVDRSKGGIETSALVQAIKERGYDARAASGTSALVQRELADGRPVIALVEDRPGKFHYVVIVGWHERAVVLHDPARTPFVLTDPAAFERRWNASGHWMLALAPRASRAPASRSDRPSRNADDDARSDSAAQGSCDALVADGVRLAQQNDLSGAERLLSTAAYQCPGAAPVRELAGVRLLQKRWPEVRDLAGRALEIDGHDAHSWRLLATARYVDGDPRGALEAWNHAGEPVIDLVSISGLSRISHRSVERVLGTNAGDVLSTSAFDRAERRLAEIPAAMLTRLDYVPRPSARAEIRAHVVEQSVVPSGRLTWAAIGLRAAASREISIGIANLAHGGDRLDATWRFWPHRPAAGVALHVPSAVGLFSLELFSERQPFSDDTLAAAKRIAAQARLADWSSGSLRWEVRSGFARWDARGSFATAGGSVRIERGRLRVGAGIDGWLGGERFALGEATAGWRSSTTRRGFLFEANGRAETVGEDTPLDLWRAGDTGHARAALLRAHPLLDDGRVQVERLGRRVLSATMEAQHWWRVRSLVPVGGSIFVDAARTSTRITGSSLGDVDVGAGFRLALPGRSGTFRADFAHGLGDGRNAFSVSWMPD